MSEFHEAAVALSPDGNWLAYQSNESGQNEIYVRAFPDMSAKQQISVGGGTSPLWANSGRELFYVDSETRMVAARITASTVVEVEEREVLFPVEQYHLGLQHTNFDISPDDQRFIMTRTVGAGDNHPARVILIEHWFEELRARVGNEVGTAPNQMGQRPCVET